MPTVPVIIQDSAVGGIFQQPGDSRRATVGCRAAANGETAIAGSQSGRRVDHNEGEDQEPRGKTQCRPPRRQGEQRRERAAQQHGHERQQGQQIDSQYEVAILTKGGETRWLQYSGNTIEYQGQPAVLGTAIDITARKEIEQTLSLIHI